VELLGSDCVVYERILSGISCVIWRQQDVREWLSDNDTIIINPLFCDWEVISKLLVTMCMHLHENYAARTLLVIVLSNEGDSVEQGLSICRSL
jgi:hypothetical protein